MVRKQEQIFVGISLYDGAWFAAIEGSDRVGEGDTPQNAVLSLVRQLPGDDFPKDPAAYSLAFSPIQVQISSHQGTIYATVNDDGIANVGTGTNTEEALTDLLTQLAASGFPMDPACYNLNY